MNTRQSGLTLLELLVIIAITAILAAIAVPSFSDMLARRRLESATNGLAADLISASTEAVSRNGTVSVATDSDGASYAVTYVPTNTTLKTVTFPTGVTSTASVTVSYQPARGNSNAATIDLSSAGLTPTLEVKTNVVGTVEVCTPNGAFSGYSSC